MFPPLFKYNAGHGLVDKLVVVMFAVSDESGMVAKRSHFLQVFLHIMVVVKKQVPEQAVDGEHGGKFWEIPADRLYSLPYGRPEIPKFQ